MPLVPHRFLVRLAQSCRYFQKMPVSPGDGVVELPEEYEFDNLAAIDGDKNFASVRLAWNEMGIGVSLHVRGKPNEPAGSLNRLMGSDGLTLWIDTRDARASHRATRYCHEFHILASAGGPDSDEPVVVQSKIGRALEDAPLTPSSKFPVRCYTKANGYRLNAFLPATALQGFDPEQHSRVGIFYMVVDSVLGHQLSNLTFDFPFGSDPSLWTAVDLVRGEG